MSDVGKITISRVQCSGGDDYMSVAVTDSHFKLTRALTGLGYVGLTELRIYPEHK